MKEQQATQFDDFEATIQSINSGQTYVISIKPQDGIDDLALLEKAAEIIKKETDQTDCHVILVMGSVLQVM